jgi:hypothetical protein
MSDQQQQQQQQHQQQHQQQQQQASIVQITLNKTNFKSIPSNPSNIKHQYPLIDASLPAFLKAHDDTQLEQVKKKWQ